MVLEKRDFLPESGNVDTYVTYLLREVKEDMSLVTIQLRTPSERHNQGVAEQLHAARLCSLLCQGAVLSTSEN